MVNLHRYIWAICGACVLMLSVHSVAMATTCQTGGRTYDESNIVWSKYHKAHLYCAGDNNWRYLSQWGLGADDRLIYSGGNIGIGINTPARKLDIHQLGQITLSNQDGNTVSNVTGVSMLTARPDLTKTIEGASAGSGNKGWMMAAEAESAGSSQAGSLRFMYFDGDGWLRYLFITKTGNVGIGTPTPSEKLEVVDDNDVATVISIKNNNASGAAARSVLFLVGDGSNQQNSGGLMYGNSAFSLGSSYPALRQKGLSLYTNPQATGGISIVSSAAGAPITFNTGGFSNTHERLRVTGDGNVGIGTANPLTKLHVENGSVLVADLSNFPNGDATGVFILSSGGLRLIRTSAPNVSEVNGYIDFTASADDSAPYARLAYDYSKKQFSLMNTDHNAGLYVEDRVGIGTMSPTQKLQVNGLIDVTNNRILRVATPTATTDAANKAYVDSLGGKNCTSGQLLKWNGTTWACAGDAIGSGGDNLGAGGTTTGTLYTSSGAIGLDSANSFTFSSAGNVTLKLNNAINYGFYPGFFRAWTNDAVDLGTSAVKWRNAYMTGTVYGNLFSGDSANLNTTGTRAVTARATGANSYGVNAEGTLYGVYGRGTVAAGVSYGVRGQADGTQGIAVYGQAASATGNTRGGSFQSVSPTGYGVYATNTAATGSAYGAYVTTSSTAGTAIYGFSTQATGGTTGIHGRANSTSGKGVHGFVSATSGTTYGVYGQVSSVDGYGVYSQGNAHVQGRLTASGNIGLGTNDPTHAIHVIRGTGIYVANSTAANATAVLITSDGGIKLARPTTASSPNVNGYIDFVATTSDTVYGRLQYSVASKTFSIINTSGDANLAVNKNVTAAAYFQSSDRNLKTDIERIVNPFDILDQIEGKRFVWKDSKKPAYGVIAQDVEAVIPDAVGENADGFKTVEYDQLIAPLIEAVKELRDEVKNLRAENDNLRHEVNLLKEGI